MLAVAAQFRLAVKRTRGVPDDQGHIELADVFRLPDSLDIFPDPAIELVYLLTTVLDVDTNTL